MVCDGQILKCVKHFKQSRNVRNRQPTRLAAGSAATTRLQQEQDWCLRLV